MKKLIIFDTADDSVLYPYDHGIEIKTFEFTLNPWFKFAKKKQNQGVCDGTFVFELFKQAA